MKTRMVIVVAIMAMLAGLLSFSAASAEPDKLAKMEGLFHELVQSEDPEAFFKALSESDRSLVLEALKVVEVREEVDVVKVDAPSGLLLMTCWYGQARRVGENIFGIDLWRFHQRVDWCSENGTTISLPTPNTANWVDVIAPFWQYTGIVSSSTTGGVGYTYYNAMRQGEFKICVPSIACAQHSYPWLRMIAYPNGTYNLTGGGGSGW